MFRMKTLEWRSLVLLVIGGLNWGLVGLFNFNLVNALFGEMSAVTRLIYLIVGLAAVWMIITVSIHFQSITKYEETRPHAVAR